MLSLFFSPITLLIVPICLILGFVGFWFFRKQRYLLAAFSVLGLVVCFSFLVLVLYNSSLEDQKMERYKVGSAQVR
jgi:fumarate reductase subunit D